MSHPPRHRIISIFLNSLQCVCVCARIVRSHSEYLRYFPMFECVAFALLCAIIKVNCRQRNGEIHSRSKTIQKRVYANNGPTEWGERKIEKGKRKQQTYHSQRPEQSGGIFSFHFNEKYWNIKSNRNSVYTFLQFRKITSLNFTCVRLCVCVCAIGLIQWPNRSDAEQQHSHTKKRKFESIGMDSRKYFPKFE